MTTNPNLILSNSNKSVRQDKVVGPDQTSNRETRSRNNVENIPQEHHQLREEDRK